MTERVRQPFVHVHIPKTAGTSLRAAFIKGFGAERVAFMMPERSFVKTSELVFDTEELDQLRRIARKRQTLPQFSIMVQRMNKDQYYSTFGLEDILNQNISVATGHIRHTDLVSSASALDHTTVVRDPLQRAWSHYVHWREARGSMWWHDGTVPYSDEVSFEAFVNDPALANYQSNYLGKLACAEIGSANKLDQFIARLGLNGSVTVPKLNTGLYEALPNFDSAFIRNFTELNRADYELFALSESVSS